MSLSPDDVQQFSRAAQSLERAVRALEGGSSNTAKISVNASGVGVWFAMLFVQSVMLAAIVILFVKFDRTQDYVNSIFMQVPQLAQPAKEK